MGFSPGEFYDMETQTEVHWEGKGSGRIYLWSKGEAKILLNLRLPDARQALNQLQLLVDLAEAYGL